MFIYIYVNVVACLDREPSNKVACDVSLCTIVSRISLYNFYSQHLH